MSHVFKSLCLSVLMLLTLGLTGCSTLTSAYDSVTDTVTGVFKSDGDKK